VERWLPVVMLGLQVIGIAVMVGMHYATVQQHAKAINDLTLHKAERAEVLALVEDIQHLATFKVDVGTHSEVIKRVESDIGQVRSHVHAVDQRVNRIETLR
jgi:hypothetical protein